MTEEEAKTKWCPFIRIVRAGEFEFATNRMSKASEDGGNCLCIASACMAWRAHTKSWNATTGAWLERGRVYLTSDVIEQRPTNEGRCGLAS